MKRLVEFVGAIAVIQGAGGLLHTATGRLGWGFVQRVRVFDGYETYASVALVVLGIALVAAAGRGGDTGR